MRLFIAVPIPDEIKNNITQIVSELNKTPTKVRWVKKESMHLTLKFIGNVEEKKADEITDALKTITFPEFQNKIEFKDIGFFPNRRRPRVIWVGIKDYEKKLSEWALLLEGVLEPLGFPKEKRGFKPHLTIGRIKSPEEMDSILRIVNRRRGHLFGTAKPDKVILFQSILKPTGAEYKSLHSFHV